jgi:transcription elongation factor Elf1
VTDTAGKILKKLKEQQKEEGKLPLLLEFYQKLVQVQATAHKRLTPPAVTLNSEEIKARLAQGRPLAGFDELNIDWELVREVFSEIIDVFAVYPSLFGELPDSLKKSGAGRLLTAGVAKAWFNGVGLPSNLFKDIGETLLRTIIQATLQPFLAGYARAYQDSLKQTVLETWRRAYCPVCGGSPDMAYLEKEVGARWLVCSRCDTEWLFQRLQCPYCGTQQQDSLSFFADDSELYRLYVCEKCKGYLKTIDLRKAVGEVLLPLERLMTAEMDRQARERGYG